MSRIVILFIAMCLTVRSYSRSDWYDKPLSVDVGATMIDVCTERPASVTAHVRASADRHKQAAWGIAWGDIYGGCYRKATLHLPKAERGSELYPQTARVVVSAVDEQKTVTLIDMRVYDIDLDGGYNTLKLQANRGEEILMVGSSEPTNIALPHNDGDISHIYIITDTPIQCCHISTDIDTEADAPRSRYTSVEALMLAIAESTDPYEGVWEYLDRNIDEDKASLGGTYTLATVRGGDGYDIVYLKGAKADAQDWEPLRLKGHLRPTIFKGNYDMVWYGASGLTVDEDVDAQFSDDGAILTLRFPILDSSIRLRRLILR